MLMTEKQTFFSIPKAAKVCSVSRATMWNWVKSGKVAAFVTPGGHHRIPSPEVDRLINANGAGRVMGSRTMRPHIKRLLIVDDDAALRKLYTHYLSGLGYDVLSAANGFEAGVMVSQRRPDLVLLDLFMEGLDGFEVCRTLKNDPDLRFIRILAISGVEGDQVEARILGEGADAFIPKSAGLEVIASTIDTLLKDILRGS
jgi:CheY-like chemotaxis protein/predicted DNA-binding transcriptional regulator AlpA